MRRDRLIQLTALALAAGMLACSSWLQGRLEPRHGELGMLTAGQAGAADNPRVSMLKVAPGGLKALAITYLWIRSQELKNDGRFYDAKQLRDLICDLMPHFPGVWDYHAWDMAWNISVATHTPGERWNWVHNGIRLLRDRGIVFNPDNLILYKQLSWIFFSKMGQDLDDMHMVYKRRWAGKMQQLLGEPPRTGLTRDMVGAFRNIAEAPADLASLRAHADADAFLKALGPGRLDPPLAADAELLRYYNRFSISARVRLWGSRVEPPATDREKKIAALIDAEEHTSGRVKVLAFVRRKLLVEQYRMDPEWMLKLMEKYGPLDWRHVDAHSIYWASYGLHRAMGMSLEDIRPALAETRLALMDEKDLVGPSINLLNTERNVLNSLKMLALRGLIYYTPNPDAPEDPFLDFAPDYRFIESTHREYLAAGQGVAETEDPDALTDQSRNTLRDAHINYLSNAVIGLYFAGRDDDARHYYDLVRRRLKPTGEEYKLPLHGFVQSKLAAGDLPPAKVIKAAWDSAILAAYRALAGGNRRAFSRYRTGAVRAYQYYLQAFPHVPRLRQEDYRHQEAVVLKTLLVQPRLVGVAMPLFARARLYHMLATSARRDVYSDIAPYLYAQFIARGLGAEAFHKAFPAPPDVEPFEPPASVPRP